MKKVISGGRIPIKMWLDDIEEKAIVQAINLSNLPFAYHHVAIMPDAHEGYGMPIGGVLATKGVVIPNAVGVDIFCGMSAFNTGIRKIEINKKKLEKLLGILYERIPTGFNHHAEKQEWEGFKEYPNIHIIKQEIQAAQYQCGTLGGGNHFQEIQEDDKGFIWIMLHSGSRNFGYKIAKEYNNKAIELNKKWFSPTPKDLAFLPLDSEEGLEYMQAMNYAGLFAKESRKRMMTVAIESFSKIFGKIDNTEILDVAHNYAAMEHHFGENVLVHRKGAVRARKDDIVIIPGSQGTKSYIAKGLGNPDSFTSCSHGAGRKMSRSKAKENLSLDIELKKMKGIVHMMDSKKDLDEAPGAYKNIETVMKNQEDLVEIIVELKPLAVLKAKESE